MPPQIRQYDNADALPPYNGGDTAPYEHPRPKARMDWPSVVATWVGGIVLLLVVYWLVGRDVKAWLGTTEGGIFKALVALVVCLYIVRRFVLVRQPGGYLVSLQSTMHVSAEKVMLGRLSVEETHAATPGRLLAQQTFSPTYNAPQIAAGDDTVDAEIVSTVPMLPPSEWLTWFDTRPHGLLAAETGGGKSTTFKAVVKSRIERGELVFLIDPHSSDWFGLPSIGGGEDWPAVWAGMQVVIAEYHKRMQERNVYLKLNNRELPHDHFKRITVLLDEANAACLQLSGAKRGEKSKWDQFALALGSGARKVGISIQLLAQSANVEDLQLSGPMVNNFTRLCLDARSVLYLVRQSGDDPERKRELLEAIRDEPYPAAAMQNGRVVLLDRTGLDQVGTPHNPRASLWTEGYERAEQLIGGRTLAQPSRPVVSAAAVASETVRASVPAGAIIYPQTVQSTNGKIAWLLRQGYSYRQIERELSVSHATIRQVSVALQRNAKGA